ncbi:MAG: DNA repair protein RadA [Patescibacteria group bacterium]|nr:MAG: DNA repair protein RadA [Patescibacteria group bacterium]
MQYECINCGYQTAKWLGKCPQCGSWDSFVKLKKFQNDQKASSSQPAELITIDQLKKTQKTKTRLSTQISEFDRVLSGGIVKGSVTLFTGEPGIGKSTILLQLAKNIKLLYVSAEESLDFVYERVKRLNVKNSNLTLTDTKEINSVLSSIGKEFQLVIIDSIQTVYTSEIESPQGSISQLNAILNRIIEFAKKNNTAFIVVGHRTKSGEYAGPKTLEHMVDCVLSLDGDKNSDYRILSTTKNRFGNTAEVGMFKMTNKGLVENFDPLIFVDKDKEPKIGRVITAEKKGKRIIFYEVQSLVVPTFLSLARRVAKGINQKKLMLLLAVIKKYLNLPIDKYDIYVSITSASHSGSDQIDLAIIFSIYSSLKNKAFPTSDLFVGPVDLLGQVRVNEETRSIAKIAKQTGFKKIITESKKNIKELIVDL